MKVLLYEIIADETAKRLRRVVEALVSEEDIEIYQSLHSLSDRLRQPRGNLAVVVLLAARKQSLTDLLHIGDLLSDLRIILILPDREDDTIAKGHTLRPRFLTCVDGDFSDVAAVMSHILKKIRAEKRSKKRA